MTVAEPYVLQYVMYFFLCVCAAMLICRTSVWYCYNYEPKILKGYLEMGYSSVFFFYHTGKVEHL